MIRINGEVLPQYYITANGNKAIDERLTVTLDMKVGVVYIVFEMICEPHVLYGLKEGWWSSGSRLFNLLAQELNIYSLAQDLCKM